MKMKFSFYKILIICPLICQAQSSNVSTLSFLETNGKESFRRSRVDPEKSEKLRTIYYKLIAAKGDFRCPIPKLEMTSGESKAVEINYDKLQIDFEEKAYDAIIQLGDEAIAFILAHELTHYFERHAWKNEFVKKFADLPIGNRLRNTEDQIINETQADYLGGFLAHTSGYHLTNKISEILRGLYEAYEIDSTASEKYPSLEDRIRLTNRSTENLQLFIDLHEMANYLLLTGRYQEAAAYYNYIIMRYQSSKLYNNLALCNVLQAKQFFNSKELKYEFPLELDNESIFERDASTLQRRDSLLKSAITIFDIALSMNPEYLPAKLNKAICHCLLNQYERAKYLCEQEIATVVDSGKFAKTLIDNKVLLGIIYDHNGNSTKAKSFFKSAADQGNAAGKRNLMIANKELPPQTAKNVAQEGKLEYGGMTLAKYMQESPFDSIKTMEINSLYSFYQSASDTLPYNVYFNLRTSDNMVNYFMLSKESSDLKSKNNIGNGSTSAQITNAYGQPDNITETVNGSAWIYKSMIFIFDKNNIVKRWGNYVTKQFL